MEALKSLGQPSQELLQTVLDQVVEGRFGDADSRNVNNVHAALMLVQWLPDIQSHDLQVWLSESLKTLCGNGTHNRINCGNEGMISAILNILQREKQINPIAVGMYAEWGGDCYRYLPLCCWLLIWPIPK